MPALGSDDFLQSDHVVISQSLQELDLPDSCYGKALLLIVHSDLLESHPLFCMDILAKIHLAISALAYLVQLRVTARKTTVLAKTSMPSYVLCMLGKVYTSQQQTVNIKYALCCGTSLTCVQFLGNCQIQNLLPRVSEALHSMKR